MKAVILRLKPELIFPLLISFIIALFAFYIDEGKYNFVGIFDFENLFFLGFYVLLFFGIQNLILMGLGSLALTRNISLILQSIISVMILIVLIITFFISLS